ncbi:MAG: hypothetical protein GY807_20810 [Gammaproteobacteria bacterium]|nr:hypothetical protein [Gammaproteobacteria bacterium]
MDMQLRRLAGLEQKKLQEERRELQQRIKYLQGLLASEAKRLDVVVEETRAIKAEFATPRRTVILADERQAAGMATTTEAELAIPTVPPFDKLRTP